MIEAGQDQINHIQYIVDIMHAPFPQDMSRPDRMKAVADLDLDSPEAKKRCVISERSSHPCRSHDGAL